MRILLTGGTGLIGKHFIQSYPDFNYTVVTRSPDKYSQSENMNYISQDQLEQLTDIDAVINLQGENLFAKRWNQVQKAVIRQSRLAITEKLVDLINQRVITPKAFISGSAIGFYGRQTIKNIAEDFNQPYVEYSHTLCQDWENTAAKASDHCRVCLLRTGIVLSTKGGALQQMLPTFKLGLGSTIASGQQYMSWIHIDDMVAAIHFILTQPSINGAVNATAPNPVTNIEFSHCLANVLSRPCWLPLPATIARLMLGEVADILIHGQHVIPQKLADHGFTFSYPTLSTALHALLKKRIRS